MINNHIDNIFMNNTNDNDSYDNDRIMIIIEYLQIIVRAIIM